MRGKAQLGPIDAGAVLHYADAARYDERYAAREDDLPFYTRAALRTGGPVLEYGCGTGRVTLPLARAGVAVVGVDWSQSMLAGLAERLTHEPPEIRKRITLHRGDMRAVRLRRSFPLVIAPFNTFQHLYTRHDVERFLACVRHHLSPQGTLLFDLYLPHMRELDPDAERSSYNPLTQVLRIQYSDDGEDQLSHRQFFPREIEMLLTYNGFDPIRVTADFTRTKLHADAVSMVVRCQKAG